MSGGRQEFFTWRRGEQGPRGPAGMDGQPGRDGAVGPPSDTTATVIQCNAGQAINGYRVVKVVNNLVYYVDNSIEDDAGKAIGISLNSASINDPVNIRCFGVINDSSMNLTGQFLWLGMTGELLTHPGSGIYRQQVGQVVSPTALNVAIGEVIFKG